MLIVGWWYKPVIILSPSTLTKKKIIKKQKTTLPLMLHAWITLTNNAGCCFQGENILRHQVRTLIPPNFKRKMLHHLPRTGQLGPRGRTWYQNTSQIPLQSNPIPSFNQCKSKGLFVFLDCPEAPFLAVDMASSPNFLRGRMAWVCCARICCSEGSAKTQKELQRSTYEGKSSTPTEMELNIYAL